MELVDRAKYKIRVELATLWRLYHLSFIAALSESTKYWLYIALSAGARSYNYVNDVGGKNIGSWIDSAASQARR